MEDNNPTEKPFDPFPEKRKDERQLDRHGFNVKEIEHILSKVMQFLMTKALHEKQKQNRYNPTVLGGVKFHIDYNDITKQTKLVFDKHPKFWNESEIYKEMNDMEADMMMEKQFQEDILDNPFTY